MRILRDPSATDGAAVAAPVETVTKAAETRAAEKPLRIEVDPSEYAGLYQQKTTLEARLAQFEAEKTRAIEAERQKYLQEIAETKGAKAALEEQQRQLQAERDSERKARMDLESNLLAEKKANVIADALAGVEFTNDHAARDARRKLEERFGVERDSSGKVVVRDLASGRFAADSIPELIKGDEFAHFLKPATRGGSGTAQRPGHQAGAHEVPDEQAEMMARVKAHLEAAKANTIGL